MNKKKKRKKNKKKTHGALKTREAFKGTLKQWGLIRQAMLAGTENIDCFCDYTLTLSNVCGREGNYSSWGFFWSLFSGNVCLQLHVGFCFFFTCVAFCAHVRIAHRQDEETETVPQGKQGGNERSDGGGGGTHTLSRGGVLLSSCFSSSRSLLENKSTSNNQRDAARLLGGRVRNHHRGRFRPAGRGEHLRGKLERHRLGRRGEAGVCRKKWPKL